MQCLHSSASPQHNLSPGSQLFLIVHFQGLRALNNGDPTFSLDLGSLLPCQLLSFPPGISWPSNVYLVLSTFCFLPPSSHQPLNHSAAFLQNLSKLAASCRLVVVQCYPESSSSCRAWKSGLLPDFFWCFR